MSGWKEVVWFPQWEWVGGSRQTIRETPLMELSARFTMSQQWVVTSAVTGWKKNDWGKGILLTSCPPLPALPQQRQPPCSPFFKVISSCITVVLGWQTLGLLTLMQVNFNRMHRINIYTHPYTYIISHEYLLGVYKWFTHKSLLF